MVNALREEPGTYTRDLEGGAEVLYWIRPHDDGFVAGWEYRAIGTATGEEANNTREVSFASHADALKFLEEDFDAPLESR